MINIPNDKNPSTIIIPTILPLHNPNPFFIHLIIVNGKKTHPKYLKTPQ